MTLSLAFSICTAIVFPQWLLMILAPKWKLTQKLIASRIIPFSLAIAYLYFFFTLPDGREGSLSSLEELMRLWTNEQSVLVAWLHILAIDLLVGTWMFQEAQEKNIHHGLLVPCLICCLLFAPMGFVLYWLIYKFKEKSNTL